MAVKNKNKAAEFFIAAIGASAGGLEALQNLISGIPKNTENLAIIVAQHLGTESMLPELLASKTDFDVTEIKNDHDIQSRVIYVASPNQEIVSREGRLYLSRAPIMAGPKPSLNLLFSSLAKDHQNRVIGVILSGTGADGANGMKEVAMAGGVTIVQDPDTAKFRGMPEAAIEATPVDWVLAPEEIGMKLADIVADPKQHVDLKIGEEAFYKIIEVLEQVTGTDFNNYKQETLFRRMEKRLSELKLPTLSEYYDYLKNHSEEAEILFRKVLIGVTGFFRDPAVFESLERYVEKLLVKKKQGEPLRVWVPGCATGEEAYSVAMIIDAKLRKKKLNIPVQIFATDINDGSLIIARKGVYDKKSIEKAPPRYVERYLTRLSGDMYEINKGIRSMILFSRHDLSHHPPFLRLDLIVCRNLLIYFNKRLQEQIFRLFYTALNSNAYLVLGKSESVGKLTDLFGTVQSDAKIYQRTAGSTIRRLRYGRLPIQQLPKLRREITIPEIVKETLYSVFKYPYVVVNDSFDIQEISGDVSLYMGLKPGQMNANMIKLAHKDLRIELKSLALNCTKEGREVQSQVRKFNSHGHDHYVRFTMRPLLYQPTTDQFYMIVFEAVKQGKSKEKKVEPAKKEQTRIRELEEELENTRADLQDFIERLEESNIQLQSLNEELQSSNEELRISNEELETANEELQSSNEEILTTYQELKAAHETLTKQEQLLRESRANTQALINNSLQGFILLDRNYHVITFNEMAKKVMKLFFQANLRKGEGLNESGNDHYGIFSNGFRESLTHKTVQKEYELVDKKGVSHVFNFNFTPVLDEQGKIESVSVGMLDITDWRKAKQDVRKLSWVARYTNNGVMITDHEGRIQWVNEGFQRLTGWSFEQVENKLCTKVVPDGELRADAVKKIETTLTKKRAVTEVLLKYTKDEKQVWVSLDMTPIFEKKKLTHFIGVLTDITGIIRAEELKKNQEALEQRQHLIDGIASNFPDGIVGLINSDLRYVYVGGSELKRLGRQRKDMLDTMVLDQVFADTGKLVNPQLKKVFEGESIYLDVPAGEEVYGLHAVPVAEGNNIAHALVVLHNITQRKRAETETLKALKQQKELNDLKSRFVTLASHEFRTPLSTILSSAYLIEQFEEKNDRKNTQKHLQRIQGNVKILTEILNEFLSLSKIEEGTVRNNPVEFDVKQFCSELIEGLTKKEGQEILYRHKGGMENIYVDKGHLINILNKLLSNASKYSSQDKRIWLTSESIEGAVIFSVQDEGIGIPTEDQEQLFGTFFRGRNASNIQGTGLGLHLVKRYLDIIGGAIDFVSIPGKGSTFNVTIPQMPEMMKTKGHAGSDVNA
ncbi:Chemotaxis protein methyltransferase CheR [Fulvivirga imtechensis AK7]|uniref:Chemotaxis protein methyltransferase CheR n=1 Tax=Fulvivirga imtechensis AK7 TaxID=1237149 RepID=L8JI64_9BACT|nr:CheR family methyltransferase [Fulvivirga imtechensis]ELR68515.1 Chemotaxis protein methyltransferase CheR [Fulvivirga imtechensis AK7]